MYRNTLCALAASVASLSVLASTLAVLAGSPGVIVA